MVERNLIAIAENHLEKEMSRKIQMHLELCERCALLCQSFTRAWQNLAPQEERTLSPSFFSNLMKTVAAYDEKPSRWKYMFVPVLRFLRPAVMTLLLLAGIFAGYELGNISQDGTRPDDSFAGRLLGSFEDIPKGSVADFYVGRQILEKEKIK